MTWKIPLQKRIVLNGSNFDDLRTFVAELQIRVLELSFKRNVVLFICLNSIYSTLGLVLWTLWHFYLQRLLWHTEQKITKGADGTIDHGKTVQHDQNFNMSTPERQLRSRKKKEDH